MTPDFAHRDSNWDGRSGPLPVVTMEALDALLENRTYFVIPGELEVAEAVEKIELWVTYMKSKGWRISSELLVHNQRHLQGGILDSNTLVVTMIKPSPQDLWENV